MKFEEYADAPDHFYRNRLPHFDPKDAPYSVTYRLQGSIPRAVQLELKERMRRARTAEEHAAAFLAWDAVLDKNGPYHLQQAEVRRIVMESLAHLDGKDIQLLAFCVMPNHVHAIFDLLSKRKLYNVMRSHKSFTAREANIVLGTEGRPFREHETYDHVIREGRLGEAIWYELLNPVKAGFVKNWRDWLGTWLSPNIYGFEQPSVYA